MKQLQFILLLFFTLNVQNINAQITEDENIFFQKQKIQESKNSTDSLLIIVEQLKLKNIQSALPKLYPSAIKNEEIVLHSAFALSYNDDHEQANWVMHLLSKDILYGLVGRTNDFRIDPLLKCGSVDSVDYWESGYDRGHLAPSADFRWSKTALSESYYYSNMSPQLPEFNRGAWSKLENQVREWSLDAGELYVVTGPVLNDNLAKVPQGTRKVSIPKLYYKIILDLVPPFYKATAFLMPNKDLQYRIADYVVSIDSIENLTGIDFFPSIDDTLENRLEASHSLQDWPINYITVDGTTMPKKLENGELGTSQAKYFIGTECTICGKIVSTKYNINGKSNPTYISFDKKYPDTPFYILILEKDRKNFSYEPEKLLYGKDICVKGKVNEYKGTPNIIVNDENQIIIK